MKKTGSIWNMSPRKRAQIIRRVCEILAREYENTRLDNPNDPVDDLVYIILSNKTTPSTAQRVYYNIKEYFSSWEEFLQSKPNQIKEIINPAGLAEVKTTQIRGALEKIRSDFGSCKLETLRDFSEKQSLLYLTSLPGVSGKVARCVILYTLEGEVLPVDSHVHRISKRLGWTSRRRADQSHEELEALVPGHRRYLFHVNCIQHGRSICRPSNPLCEKCTITRYCEYYKEISIKLN